MEQPRTSILLAIIAVFSALIALLTILAIPLPPPLYEITFAPPIYLALAALTGPWTAFSSIAIGSFIGESYNIATRGGPPIYIFGIVWARAPEAFIVGLGRNKGTKKLAAYMVVATIYETLAFFFPDWAFYYYGLFGYGNPASLNEAFLLAAYDFGTLIDLFYIPVALAIARISGPVFKRLGF
jgi:uncharacterized membrane protein